VYVKITRKVSTFVSSKLFCPLSLVNIFFCSILWAVIHVKSIVNPSLFQALMGTDLGQTLILVKLWVLGLFLNRDRSGTDLKYRCIIARMCIYESIQKPIIGLSPMEDVTASVFRQVIKSLGKIDLMYTEFVNVEGLNSEGKDKVIQRFEYNEIEKPIIAQLWGSKPDNFYSAAILARELGFEGIDINMGCAVKKVSSRNAGIGMINADRALVEEIIQSVKDGAGMVPVSVKTRLGWSEYDRSWIEFLLKQSLDALTIHGRTAVGKNAIEADWEKISLCVKLRDEIDKEVLIFGNGDIKSIKQAM
jgi:tRNA-dihydrouridine synthase